MTTKKPPAKTIRDSVHGDIQVFAEDLHLLDSAQVQRLRGIKQLGSAYHVYPGAQHTRFEHSLGTYHIASRLIDRLRQNHRKDPGSCRDISRTEASIARAVALLHDITHIPHGHAIEDQDGLFPRHDKPSFLKKAVSRGELGKELTRRRILGPVSEHLSEKGARGSSRPFLSLIANGPLGADMLDYLRRDGHHTGLHLGYDDRLLDYIKIDPGSGVVYVDLVKHDMDREDILTEIVSLLRSRYLSSERIYYHHAKLASGALISRAVEIAIQGGLTRDSVSDSTDDTLAGALLDRDYSGHPLGEKQAAAAIRGLLDRYRNRRLLKRCVVVARPEDESLQKALVRALVNNQKERMALERDIARTLEIPDPAEVIVYCPQQEMQLKEASVPVRRARRGIRPLSRYQAEFPALGQLVESYRNLWKLYVFVPMTDPDRLDWAGKRVERLLRKSFPGIKNQYRP